MANLTLVGNGESGVVNDVIVTDTAAYFTDSLQAQIYKVCLYKKEHISYASVHVPPHRRHPLLVESVLTVVCTFVGKTSTKANKVVKTLRRAYHTEVHLPGI